MTIFSPYRAIGYICDSTQFSVQRRGKETFVTTSVGKAWQIYNCGKLSLAFVGPPVEKTIKAIASWRDFTFAAIGNTIAVFNRARRVTTWSVHTDRVILLLTFGDHILSVGLDSRLCVWPAAATPESNDPMAEIMLPEGFTPSCIMHPETYLNKVLLGSEEGSLQLWNLQSKKLVYTFAGWNSPVRCIASSPALDTVAVGCADGKVHVHNLKYDETLMSFTHSANSAVTSLSFRSDGQPILAAGGASGVISVWDLEQRKLRTMIKDGHDGRVVSLHFLAKEPVLLSSGTDNALKMWIFDSEDGEARLLRFRSGHCAPPCCIEYYGNGQHILSAGQDRAFRIFSTIQDQQSRELSQGHVGRRAKKLKLKEEEVKLSKVVAFASCEVRERDWCNVVTCHEGDTRAYTWLLHSYVIGQHVLSLQGGPQTPISSCTISACGHFALLGSQSGRVERFNLQSGRHRGCFQMASPQYSPAHAGAVTGLATDATNSKLFSAGLDALIKVWDFKSGQLLAFMDAGTPLSRMVLHRANGLVAVTGDDKVLRVYDGVSYRLVRKFQGHRDRVTDACFSQDGRWALTAGMDRTVRVWDLLSGRQLDCMCTDVAVTALSLSPGMDMLATAHVGRKGIYLWANKLMYADATEAFTVGSGQSEQKVALPGVSAQITEEEAVDAATPSVSPKHNAGEIIDPSLKSPLVLPSLISLALLPRSQWQTLVRLDVIKERNKPVEPPKPPEQAPFFLPTLPNFAGETVFAPTGNQEIEAANENMEHGTSRVKRKALSDSDSLRSPFLQLLWKGRESSDYSELLLLLRGMSASAMDVELRSLEIVESLEDVPEERVEDISCLLHFLTEETRAGRAFELIQALLHRTLTIHGEVISQHQGLRKSARALLPLQSKSWNRLDSLFQSVRCVVGYLSNSVQ